MKIEVGIEDANAITVSCLKSYYMSILKDSGDSSDWGTLMALDEVMCHFMTDHEYEDFNNGLRQNTLAL